MSTARRIAVYLGLAAPAVQLGFVASQRGDRSPVCQTCGALVALESQDLHERWHRGSLSR